MTTYHLRDEANVERFTGTITPPPGGGSQPGAVRWLGPCKINAFSAQEMTGATNGSAAGGTFTITYSAITSSPITFDADTGAIVSAIESLDPSFVGKTSVTKQVADVNNNIFVNFKDGVATQAISVDAAGLTGPDSPYAVSVDTNGLPLFEMLTPDVGDIIEDFLHSVVTGFDVTTLLYYTDSSVSPTNGPPIWSNPTSWTGADGLDLGSANEFTNFSGSGSSGASSKPTPLQAMVAAPVASQSTDMYSNLPAVVLNSIPIYSYITYDSPPSQGEVWIWVKVSTPAPLMD
jgi:hypothetical protein